MALALGIAAVVTTALVAHEAARASAVLSGLAVIAAVLLGRAAYGASTRQLRQSELATYLSHRPLLVPVHETPGMLIKQADAVGLDGRPGPSFPAQDSFPIEEPQVIARVFRVNARSDRVTEPRAALFLRNVGQGPAWLTALRLESAGGHVGSLTGRVAIGAGNYEELRVELRAAVTDPPPLRDRLRVDLPADLADLPPDRVFLLELSYEDVFEDRRQYSMRAWFDPRERGAWRIV